MDGFISASIARQKHLTALEEHEKIYLSANASIIVPHALHLGFGASRFHSALILLFPLYSAVILIYGAYIEGIIFLACWVYVLRFFSFYAQNNAHNQRMARLGFETAMGKATPDAQTTAEIAESAVAKFEEYISMLRMKKALQFPKNKTTL